VAVKMVDSVDVEEAFEAAVGAPIPQDVRMIIATVIAGIVFPEITSSSWNVNRWR
jgi:hypothetical protein